MLWGIFRWKWFWRISFGLVALLILGPLLFMLWTKSQGRSALSACIAELDASDPNWKIEDLYPARNAEVRAMPKNGWTQIEKVSESLSINWDKDSLQLSDDFNNLRNNQLPYPPTLESLRELVEQNQQSVKLAREMVKYPQGGREITVPDNPLTMLLTKVQDVRNVMSLLNYASQEAVIAGRTDESLQDSFALLNCSRSFGDEPILITQLVRMAGRGLSTYSTKRALSLGEPKQNLAELQAELLKEADINLLTAAFRGERASVHKIFQLMESGDFFNTVQTAGITPPGKLERLGLWAMKSYLPANHKVCLETMTELVAISKKPFDEQWKLYKAVPQPKRGISNFFVAMLLPATQKVSEASLRTRGEMLSVAVGISCERFRQKNGHWPATLEEIPKDILPYIPNDPFTGKPLIYKVLEDGVVIYSIGPDEKDDGGSVMQTETAKMTDFGIRLWNPEHRRLNPPEPEYPEPEDVPPDTDEPDAANPGKPS
jgi:hypothetical protein